MFPPGFLSTAISFIAGPLVDKIIGPFTQLASKYLDKQISHDQLRKEMIVTLIGATKDIEVEHSETLGKTYQTFWTAADTDKTNLMKIMWAAAVGSQIFNLFWSQFFVPLLFAYGYLPNWKAGTTAEWSYLLIAALLGMGPAVLRSGPAAGGGILGMLRSLIGK